MNANILCRFVVFAAAFSASAAELADLKLKGATDKANPIDYAVGENIRFDFRLDGVSELPADAATNAPLHVIWTRTGDDGITVKGSNDVSLAQGFSIDTSLAVPGIVRIMAYLRGANGKNLTYIGSDGKSANITFEGGAGADTHKMFLSTVEPGDFDQFWAEAKAKLAAVPFEDGVELTEVFPNTSATNTHRFYAAKIPCLGPNPVTGWLTVPKKSGKFPAIAYFEGYSATIKTPTLPTSNSGDRIRLTVNAHGYDLVGHDRQYYDDFENEFLKPAGRKTYGLEPSDYDNPADTYFYYMALRVVRAFDYLKSRPEWNGTTLIANGGSQGGLQTMWAGGLVDGITKIEPSITWGCDIGCPFNGSSNPYPSRTWGFPNVPGAYYFDSALHAKRVPLTCTAEITRLGMGDYTCPPRGVLMSYYNMRCPVSAKLVQGSTHGYTPPSPNQTFTISKGANSNVYQGPDAHTVTFRRLNGTVLTKVKVPHGGSVQAPEGPVEPDHTFKGWDHGDWLGCVTKDIQVWALYEGTKVWDAGTGYGSQSIAERDVPYSLDEYFRMYDNMAWADEFSRSGTNDVRSSYWNYDTEIRHQLSYETAGDNQKEIDGFLDINVRREKRTRQEFDLSSFSFKTVEYDFTGGGIKSNNKVAFQYGRCEIRAKLTRQRGAWPAFWMMGNTGNWPACGELDVLEQPSGGDWSAGTFHIPLPGVNGRSIGNGHPTTPEDGVHFGDGFHRFGTIVNEREIVWYVDDHIFKRMDVRDSRYSMVRDRPLFIIFGMGLQSNTWVTAAGDAPVDKYDVPELDERGVDFLVDYCRIFTNTNANNTLDYEAAPANARLSAPVTAAVWRGWDMTWGRPGSSAYQSNIGKGYSERHYIKTALSEYFAREKTDVLTFLTEPTISTGANRAELDIPDYTFLAMSANANSWNDSDNAQLDGGGYSNGRLQLFTDVMFNTKRFSVSDSCVDILKLSDEPAFTNCYAVCADLKEKATGARVKVISVNVTTTNGIETAGGTVAQGFDTLFAKLDAVKDENVVVFLQGMDQKLYSYIKARADSALTAPYHYLGNYSGNSTYQCAYATASASASAKHPDVVQVPKELPAVSYTHNPQALQATVTFDAPVAADDGLSDTFDAASYTKSMTISFPDYAGAPLSGFPVLVRLSTDISGFDYAGFQLPGGGDLRFTDASGNLIPHEIDTWNPAGESTVWVKVPSLSYSTTITAHWGCSRPARPGAEGVWDGDYVGVWHLGEDGLPLRESSGSSADFTRSTGDGVVFAAGGIVGGAVDFATASHSNSVVALDHAALEGLARGTLEVWTKQVSHTQNAGILSKRAGYNSNISYFVYDNGTSTVLSLPGDAKGTNYVTCVSTVPAMNAWNHQAFTFDTAAASDNAKSYLDGTPKATATKSVAAFSGIANLCLGGMQGGTANNYVGQIDEVRISKAVRSADWIKATHDTIADPAFATYEVKGAPAPDPGLSLSGAVAEPGFSWTNGTASVTVSAVDAAAVPEGAKVRLRIVDASGAVLGTIDRDWTGAGEYTFDTAEAIPGASLGNAYDYTAVFSVVDAEGTAIGDGDDAVATATLRLGADVAWFAADPATQTVIGGSWGGDGAPTVTNGYYVMETNAVFAAVEGRTGLVHVEAVIPSDALVSESDLARQLGFAVADGSRAGLAPMMDDDGGIVWRGLVQENGAPAWRALVGPESGSSGGAPAPLLAAMEIDYTNSPVRVSYLAGAFDGESGEPPVLSRLHDASGAEWFPAPGSGTVADGRLDVRMGGRVGAFAGISYDKAVAEVDGVRYDSLAEAIAAGDVTLLTNAEMPADSPVGTMTITTDGHTLLQGGVAVSGQTVVVQSGVCAIHDGGTRGTIRIAFGDLQNLGIATAGRSPAQIAADLEVPGANGIPKWESYILGLDAGDPASLPYADITVNGGTVSISDGGMAVAEDVGPTVTYQVVEIPDLSTPNVCTNVGPAVAPGTPVALPMGDATSRFFRIKVCIAIE